MELPVYYKRLWSYDDATAPKARMNEYPTDAELLAMDAESLAASQKEAEGLGISRLFCLVRQPHRSLQRGRRASSPRRGSLCCLCSV